MAPAASALDFTGKRVLVTGGAQGIGAAIVKKFLEYGAHVIIVDKNEETLKAAKVKYGDRVTIVQVDLTNWNQTRAAIESVLPVHHLVNNAGIMALSPSYTVDEATVDLVLGVNVKATLNVSQVVTQDAIKRGTKGVTIVNISSIADELPQGQGAGNHSGIYAVSKAGVKMMTKCLAEELCPHNIRVNYVSPGAVNAPILQGTELFHRIVEPTLKNVLEQRMSEPEEIADAVLFLSSPMAQRISGTGLLVDAAFTVNSQGI